VALPAPALRLRLQRALVVGGPLTQLALVEKQRQPPCARHGPLAGDQRVQRLVHHVQAQAQQPTQQRRVARALAQGVHPIGCVSQRLGRLGEQQALVFGQRAQLVAQRFTGGDQPFWERAERHGVLPEGRENAW
jgi:hypothetical protein